MNEKIQGFNKRYEENMTLYNMAMGFVFDNGGFAVKQMTRDEFDAAINKERCFFVDSATALFDAAKDIVDNCTPLVLCSIVGRNCDAVYRHSIYGPDSVCAAAQCPVCGKSYFTKDEKTGQYRCCTCGHTIRGAEALTCVLGNKKRKAEQNLTLDTILQFVEKNGEDMFEYDLATDQLKALWMAYCLCRDLTPDTLGYDTEIAAIWQKVTEMCFAPVWGSFEAFDLFMGASLC